MSEMLWTGWPIDSLNFDGKQNLVMTAHLFFKQFKGTGRQLPACNS